MYYIHICAHIKVNFISNLEIRLAYTKTLVPEKKHQQQNSCNLI